jgi:hypothetical protein
MLIGNKTVPFNEVPEGYIIIDINTIKIDEIDTILVMQQL